MQVWTPRRLLGRNVLGAAIAALLFMGGLVGCTSSDVPVDTASDEILESATQQSTQPPVEGAAEPSGTPQQPGGPDDDATVEVRGFLFHPEVIEVPAGATVTWENSDKILHTATSGEPDAPSGLFDGQMEGAGTSFTFTFDDPGRFPFFCSRHLHMRGEVIVR